MKDGWKCILPNEFPLIWRLFRNPVVENCSAVFTNGRYAVLCYKVQTKWGEVIHLAIRTASDEPPTWDELVEIKGALFADQVAVEIIPPAKQMVDDANMHHLWVLPDGFEVPFGLHREESWGRNAAAAGERV